MELIREINELNIKAKKGEIYEQRYNDLRNEVKEAIKNLNALIDMKVSMGSVRRMNGNRKTDIVMSEIVDSLYDRMRVDDTIQVDTDILRKELEAKDRKSVV
jgi:hypothetical protein